MDLIKAKSEDLLNSDLSILEHSNVPFVGCPRMQFFTHLHKSLNAQKETP